MDRESVNEDLLLCLLAVKHAYEAGAFADVIADDLSVLFHHGMLYRTVLRHGSLCDSKLLSNVAAYCALIQGSFVPPQIPDGALRLELGKRGTKPSTLVVSRELVAQSDKLFQTVMTYLMAIFKGSIVELSDKLNSAPNMSALDKENANYVVGMAEMTANNLSDVLSRKIKASKTAFNRIQEYFADAARFADALRSDGFGRTA